MTDFKAEHDRVIIGIPKAVLVLTRQEFLRGLKRGKYYRRLQAAERRQERRKAAGAYKTPCPGGVGSQKAAPQAVQEVLGDG